MRGMDALCPMVAMALWPMDMEGVRLWGLEVGVWLEVAWEK